MAKKIAIIATIVIILAAGIGGTTYFYIQNKNQIKANEDLRQQNSSIQQQLDQIGSLQTVYQVNDGITGYSGFEIKEEDIKEVSKPASSLGDSSITDKTQIIGKFWKIDVKSGTEITTDLLMDDANVAEDVYDIDIPLSVMPVDTKLYDYIDITAWLPNGEEYVALSHKQIKAIANANGGSDGQGEGVIITVGVSTEELQVYRAALLDLAVYGNNGFTLYVTRYINPGVDVDTVASYPVQADMENNIKFNPNIKDATRCVNTTLRQHIDEVLFACSISQNESVSSAISDVYHNTQSCVLAKYVERVEAEEEAAEEAAQNAAASDDSATADQSYQDAVNGATDSLQNATDTINPEDAIE